jgi:HEPN domain-containing protein
VPSPTLPEIAVVEVSDVSESSSTEASDLAGNSDYAITEYERLVHKLQEMESMPESQYKTMMRRLWLQWHPDKNITRQAIATRFFRVIKRHEESYRGDQDFSWLSEADASDEDDAAMAAAAEMAAAAAAHSSHPPPRSWADEFAAEEEATHTVVAEEARSQRYERRTSPREMDTAKADAFWSSATSCLQGARVLFQAASDGGDATKGLYALSVHNSQQAGELAIKSLMFRTCGITQEELKGKGAHNLLALVSRVTESGEWNLPVERDKLAFLSKAYIASRYPLDDMSLAPADKYGMAEAEEALNTAQLLRDWAALTDALPTPCSADGGFLSANLKPAPIPVPAPPAPEVSPPITMPPAPPRAAQETPPTPTSTPPPGALLRGLEPGGEPGNRRSIKRPHHEVGHT